MARDGGATRRDGANDAAARFVAQLQQIGEQAVESFRADARLQADELREATRVGDVAGLQMAFAATQFGHLTRMGEQMLELVFDAQAQWLREVENQWARRLRPWVGAGEGAGLPSPAALSAPPVDLTPSGLLDSAHAAWTIGAKVWLDALSHDLQLSPPAR